MSGSEKADARSGESASDVGKGPVGKEKAAPAPKPSRRPADVGRALRSVYDDTLREDIPDDLKDLLGRLG